ncbi:MAG TPA: hypothetical protein VME18_03230 [Acidobacteriaceae bacterium]|nr:hypothetical protein [Acidobacteriaceae bacterium]
MNRRQFVLGSLAGFGALASHRAFAAEDTPGFSSDDASPLRVDHSAIAALRTNRMRLPLWPQPVLTEGSNYHGVWLESGPQEAAVYAQLAPQTARALARSNHLIFFALQKPDGQLPCSVKPTGPGFGQIQMVVPIAATAWELARRFRDEELLRKAYAACSRWDRWLCRWRNTRGTGLCEGFCTWDTGMDNSPRWKGMPDTCPGGDARRCPKAPGLPRLCPDLSATVYGGRVALTSMAKALGRASEADRWDADAEQIRALIVERLYDPRDGAFYDLDANNRFVRVRSAATLRVLGEHVPGQRLFEEIWSLQAGNPHAFWAPYPFPSIALDDSTFVRPIPPNSWGGAAQALTALRAPRWMNHYGKSAELGHLMCQWGEAIRRRGGFHQQMDPLTGVFTPDAGGYSPAALLFLEFRRSLSRGMA